MCIIVSKPKGVEVPSIETLRNCFINNDDGCGFAYNHNGKVIIRKGFMTFEDFEKELATIPNKKDKGMVFHFRITTHGDSNGANTHPFPVTSNYKKLQAERISSDLAVAHNGIISCVNVSYKSKFSDTMVFTADILSTIKEIDANFYENEKYQELLKTLSGSKLSFINGEGDIVNIGSFVLHEGVTYSNSTYKVTRHYPSVYGNYASAYDDYESYMSRYRTENVGSENAEDYGYINLRMLPEDAVIMFDDGTTESNIYFEFLIDKNDIIYCFSGYTFEEVTLLEPENYCLNYSWDDLDDGIYEAGWYIYDLSSVDIDIWKKVRTH